MAGKALWTPDGVKQIDGRSLTRVELRPGLMEWWRQLADFAQAQEVGMHCCRCGADVTGKNSDTDASFAVACGCREWVGQNREYLNPAFKN